MNVELFLPWARGAGRHAPVKLKEFEDAAPAHDAGMNQDAYVRCHPVADMTRIPGFFGRIDRHIHHDRRSDYIIARYETPVAAVVRIIAVITHHEVFSRRNGH